jgi:hypothetical protein
MFKVIPGLPPEEKFKVLIGGIAGDYLRSTVDRQTRWAARGTPVACQTANGKILGPPTDLRPNAGQTLEFRQERGEA